MFEKDRHLCCLVKGSLNCAEFDPEIHTNKEKEAVSLGIAEISLFPIFLWPIHVHEQADLLNFEFLLEFLSGLHSMRLGDFGSKPFELP